MSDTSIHQSIEALVAEEHDLWHRGENGGLDAGGRARLAEITVNSTSSTTLLHQRQGLRDAGPTPIGQALRSKKTGRGLRSSNGYPVAEPETSAPALRGSESIVIVAATAIAADAKKAM